MLLACDTRDGGEVVPAPAGEARICTLRSASLLLRFRARSRSLPALEAQADAAVELEAADDECDAPPSSSHTRSSLPLVLTLTAFPLGVISADDTDDVCPHNLVPGVMERDVDVDVQRYSVSVLSRFVARIYGCEYESAVGRDLPGENVGRGEDTPDEGEPDMEEKP